MTLNKILTESTSVSDFKERLYAELLAHPTRYEERTAFKAVFSPTRQPKFYDLFRRSIFELQQTGVGDYDISISADCERFSLGQKCGVRIGYWKRPENQTEKIFSKVNNLE